MVPTGPVSFGDVRPYYIDQYGRPVNQYGQPVPAPRRMARFPQNYHQPQPYPNQQVPQARQQQPAPPEQPWAELLKSNQKLQHTIEEQIKVCNELEGKIEYLEFSLEQAGIQVRQYPEAITSTRDRNYTDPYGKVLEQV